MPKEWIAKYKGKFDQGWDKVREETLARQIKLGVVPAGTKLAPKPEAIKDWDKLSADEKKLFARQMEVFAGFGEYADTEIGRLITAIEETGQLDNTLIFYIIGDNGASAEGGMNGLFNEMHLFQRRTRNRPGHSEALRRTRRTHDLSALCRGLGSRGGLAVRVDQASGLQLRRNAQRDGHPLAQGDRGERRNTIAVASRDRRCPNHSGSSRASRAQQRKRNGSNPDRRREHGLHLCGCQGSEPPHHSVF